MFSPKALLTACFVAATLCTGYAQNTHESLGSAVNTPSNEMNPILSEDGQTLYFTRQNHPANLGGKQDGGDIWFSTLQEDGSWSEAKNMGEPLNNNFPNSIIGFADGGQTVYLHGHYMKDGSKPNSQGISMSRKEGSRWSFPEPVDIPYFYTKSNHISGTLHASGNIMIVTLQSYDTRGAEDLYVLLKKSDGSWTEPRNLGKNINTPYQEMTPYLAPDGKTLYFASNGYEGFGSRDIFKSVRLDNTWKKWSNPQNLGASVNTEGTELFYFLPENGEHAYLTSTQNSDGMGDINRIRIREEELQVQEKDTFSVIQVRETPPQQQAPVEEARLNTIDVSGKVLNKNNQTPLQEAKVFYRVLQSDSTRFSNSTTTNANGNFSLSLDPTQDYELMVSADGFIRERERVIMANTGSNASMQVQFLLTPIEVGAIVNLESVLFDRGTANMLPGSEENLNDVVDFLKENPAVVIEVGGHTDNQGRPDLNLNLSRERAQAVKQYLITEGGIAEERVQDKGYGGTKPITSNAIEEERSKNRRVEFTILSK